METNLTDGKFIRITFQELQELAIKSQRKVSPDKTLKQKRPTRDIYQPGRSRLNRQSDSIDNNDTAISASPQSRIENSQSPTEFDIASPESLTQSFESVTINSNDENSSGKKKRRPDIQVYVPRIKIKEQSAVGVVSQSDESPGKNDVLPEEREEEEEEDWDLCERKINIQDDNLGISVTVVNENPSPTTEQRQQITHEEHILPNAIPSTLVFERSSFDQAMSPTGQRSVTSRSAVDDHDGKEKQWSPEVTIIKKDSEGIGTEDKVSNDSLTKHMPKRYSSKRLNRCQVQPVLNVDLRAGVEARNGGDGDADLKAKDNVSPMIIPSPKILNWSEEVERELGEEEEREQSIQRNETDKKTDIKSSQNKSAENSQKRSNEKLPPQFPKTSHGRHVRLNAETHTGRFDRDIHAQARRGSLDDLCMNRDRHYDGSQDHDSDSDIVQCKSGRNRRHKMRNRSDSSDSHHSDSQCKTKLMQKERTKLHVSFDTNERTVLSSSHICTPPRRRRHYSHESVISDSDLPQSDSPKGGGILRLPPHLDTSRSNHEHNTNSPPHSSHRHNHPHSRNNHPHYRQTPQVIPRLAARGRAQHSHGHPGTVPGHQKVLFDPAHPNEPIIVSSSSPKSDTFKYSHSPEQNMSNHGKDNSFHPQQNHNYSPGDSIYSGYYSNYQHQSPPVRPPMFYPHSGQVTAPPYSYPFPYPMNMYGMDPYGNSVDQEEYTFGGMSRSQCRHVAERLFQETIPLDGQLNNVLSRRLHGEETLQQIEALRHELRRRYEQIILLEPDTASTRNVEGLLWKAVFYQVIEVLRQLLGEDRDDVDVKTQLCRVLDQGTSFYTGLLEKLQRTYKFRLEPFLDPNVLPPPTLSRAVKLSLLSAQRSYICLGDIARYREQTNNTENYGVARSWYLKAQLLAPKNGRPYNQLAILALYTKRKLEGVYYYMRSLAASNPFLTARESLMALFNEARKKAEVTERKRVEEKERLARLHQQRRHVGPRVEIWVASDGTAQQDEVNDSYEEDLQKLTAAELNKRFMLSFLNVHGKLFTKIGMETFPEVSCRMLQEIQVLIQHSPTVVNGTRFLQFFAMNMFAIDNTALKVETQQQQENCRSLLQEHAVQLAMDLFAILASRSTHLIREHRESEEYATHLLDDDLQQFIPAIKVWSDWMMCHVDFWNPGPNVKDPDHSFDINVWRSVAEFCNALHDLDLSRVELLKEASQGCCVVLLPEDSMLEGFVPIMGAPMQTTFVHTSTSKELAKDTLRIQKLQVFADYLCGIEPPMLAYDVTKRKYFSVAPSTDLEDEAATNNLRDDVISSEDEDVVLMSDEDDNRAGAGKSPRLSALKARKKELQKRFDQHTKDKQNAQAILDSHHGRVTEIEIRPQFLVPDTNCFIGYVKGIKRLVDCKNYTVVIPLVVINELDGLSKGAQAPQFDSEHAQEVRYHARIAVEYLEREFEARNPCLKALTAKGSVMESISFRSEDTDGSGINDDVILACCLHYCHDLAREYMPREKDAPIRLHRDVVLLTDDRNLRLKAHTRNVPVKDVPSFLKWSTIM